MLMLQAMACEVVNDSLQNLLYFCREFLFYYFTNIYRILNKLWLLFLQVDIKQ